MPAIIVAAVKRPPKFPKEIQCGIGAFEGAVLVSRLRPAPPIELTSEMGSPEFVVCPCGAIVRARSGTAVPRVHRCRHWQRCAGRLACALCLEAYDAAEQGGADADRFIYVLTFEGDGEPFSVVIQTCRGSDDIHTCIDGWRQLLQEKLHRRIEWLQMDRWRAATTLALFE